MKFNWKDKLGYNFEFEKSSDLKQSGLGENIKFTNAKNPYFWLKNKGKGVDTVLHRGKHRFYVEIRFHSCFYNYRTSWFQKSTVQRFHNYPLGEFDHHIVLTNRPEVYNSPAIQSIANSQGISILTIQQLTEYILSIPNSIIDTTVPITNSNNSLLITNNVYASTISYSELMAELELEGQLIKRIENERLKKLYSG